jgi:hypothetical protein
LFVVSTFTKWGVRSILRDAVVETEELVTAAVKATGIPQERVYWTELTRIEYITIQLLGFETAIRIEVWDSAPNPPALPDDDSSPVKRGYYPTAGGKVVWAEIPLIPQRRKQHLQAQQEVVRTESSPVIPPPEQFGRGQDPELLRRVQDGLEGL